MRISYRFLLLLLPSFYNYHHHYYYHALAWQQSIPIPIRKSHTNTIETTTTMMELKEALHMLVASDYTQIVGEEDAPPQISQPPSSSSSSISVRAVIPALQATLTFTLLNNNEKQKVNLLIDCAQPSDVEGICRLLYENRDHAKHVLQLQPIRDLLAKHLSSKPPHPGVLPPAYLPLKTIRSKDDDDDDDDDANANANSKITSWLQQPETLHALLKSSSQGYVVLDNALAIPENITTTTTTATTLQTLLEEDLQDTGQGAQTRTDRVIFMSRKQAKAANMDSLWDALVSCASVLNYCHNNNNNNEQSSSCHHQPLLPATRESPFTVPTELQYAEYRLGDFYKAHSDNSLIIATTSSSSSKTNSDQLVQSEPVFVRSNFRAYTCILYCHAHTDWDVAKDGGALRLYLQTQDLVRVDDVLNHNTDNDNNNKEVVDFVDIAPLRGRLLLFDSRLVHSVQPVTSPNNKVRQALTLWINRPIDDSGVQGEVYF